MVVVLEAALDVTCACMLMICRIEIDLCITSIAV